MSQTLTLPDELYRKLAQGAADRGLAIEALLDFVCDNRDIGGPVHAQKTPRRGSLADYIAEVLKNAVYEKGEQLDVIVAEAPDLPGCLTQGATFEEARENLVDAIEVWLMSGLRSGEDPPVVNGCRLVMNG